MLTFTIYMHVITQNKIFCLKKLFIETQEHKTHFSDTKQNTLSIFYRKLVSKSLFLFTFIQGHAHTSTHTYM